MSDANGERPIIVDDDSIEAKIKITDELPRFIGAPVNWMLVMMKIIVTFSGFLMAFTFGAVVVIRYGFGGDLFAYEE